MKVNIVIGNPPYSKGADLDFVDLGFKVSTDYVCMVTPAKWQTTADNYVGCQSKYIDYKTFREEYVPYMKQVVFYPDALDIFQISQVDGITYFILGKTKCENTVVINRCKHQNYYNSASIRCIQNRETLLNIGQEIIDNLGDYTSIDIDSLPKDKQYKVITNSQIVLGGTSSTLRKSKNAVGNLSNLFNSNGQATFIGEPKIMELIPDGAFDCIFSSDDRTDCENFITWLNCKFTRFLVGINISKLNNIITSDCFRFVPEPIDASFKTKCSDELLYKHYNLSQKHIEVIESIVVGRQ